MKRLLCSIAAAAVIFSLPACRRVSEVTETVIDGVVKEIHTEAVTTPPKTSTEAETTTKIAEISNEKAQDAVLISEGDNTPAETTTTEKQRFSPNLENTAAFYYDDGEAVYISAEEYYTVCGIVMNETGYGSYEGCVAVAQSIRNQIIREKHKGNPYDIGSVRATYQEHYTKKPNDMVRKAVTDVFYNHVVVTEEPIIAWCVGGSSWHNKQVLVCSYDGNNFYKLSVKDW